MTERTLRRRPAARLNAILLAAATLVAGGATAAQATPGASPTGNLDKVTAVDGGLRVFGWAWDPDTTAAASITIRVDGAVASTATATAHRDDVLRKVSGAGAARGYDVVIPATAGTREVCVTAKNVGGGSDRTFPCRTITVAGAAAQTSARPNASNTGVPAGTTLRRHDGDLVITKANTVVDGLDVRGFVDVRAPGVTIRNTIVRGRSTTTTRGLVTVSAPEYGLTITDSELVPSARSPYIDGLRGMNITARRVEIRDVIDSMHIYGDNVLLERSYLHSNAHFTNDPNWGGRPSHDDSIQIQAGRNIVLRDNVITGSKNAAIMLTQDRAPVSDVRIEGNLLDHGACVANIKPSSRSVTTPARNVSFHDNRFGRNAAHPQCGIKVATTQPLDMQRNTFTDGAAVRRTP